MVRPRGIDIVRRAYELWEQAGKPDGKDEEFYHKAEQQLADAADALEERPASGSLDQAG